MKGDREGLVEDGGDVVDVVVGVVVRVDVKGGVDWVV